MARSDVVSARLLRASRRRGGISVARRLEGVLGRLPDRLVMAVLVIGRARPSGDDDVRLDEPNGTDDLPDDAAARRMDHRSRDLVLVDRIRATSGRETSGAGSPCVSPGE
jgi:hypothetical protein